MVVGVSFRLVGLKLPGICSVTARHPGKFCRPEFEAIYCPNWHCQLDRSFWCQLAVNKFRCLLLHGTRIFCKAGDLASLWFHELKIGIATREGYSKGELSRQDVDVIAQQRQAASNWDLYTVTDSS
jgi:hypothetical protein